MTQLYLIVDIVSEMWTWGSDVLHPKTLTVRHNLGARNLGSKTGGVAIEKFRNVDFELWVSRFHVE